MAAFGKKMSPVQELIISGVVMVGAIALWYFLLYAPVVSETAAFERKLATEEDSVQAIKKYQINVSVLNTKIDTLRTQLAVWDARFPERTQIVSLATQILNYGTSHGLDLVEVKPSLYELYALERSGAHVSGRYVMQLPLSCHFRGEYLNLGPALEQIASLPFNVTIADVSLDPWKGHYPVLDIHLRLFLYVRQ